MSSHQLLIDIFGLSLTFLPLDEAIASRAVFVIVSGSDGRAGERAETLLDPAV